MAVNIPGVPFRFTGTSFPDVAEAINKPQTLAAKLLEAQLKNKHDKIINEYLPRSEEARIGYQEAETGAIPYANRLREAQAREADFYANNPLLKLPGAAGQIGAMNYLRSNPDKFGQTSSTDTGQSNVPDYAGMIEGALKGQTKKNMAQGDYSGKRAKSFAYSTAPVDAKNYMLAQAAGMGIAPDEAVNAFAEGKTVQDLANEHGFDPANLPEPDFMPTRGNITSLNQRKAALGEMDHLSNFVTEGLGPYSSTVLGWSSDQLADQLRGMNKDRQIKFLAARGLVPELTNMRLMTAGAKTTVAAINAMQDKSMLNIKAMQSKVDPEVWIGAQRLMDKELRQAMGAASKSYRLKTQQERKVGGPIKYVRDANNRLVPAQ